MADNNSSPVPNSYNLSQSQYSGTNLKVIKTDISPTGEAIQLVRPMLTQPDKSTADIVGELVSQYDYKSKELVKASHNDLTAIEQAFGKNLSSKLLTTYDGSAIRTDTQQDLIGEKYLEEQIKRAHDYQKKNSVVDRYSHLLYEGDKAYKSNSRDDIKAYAQSSSFANLKPIQQQEFVLQQSKLQPSSSNLFSSSSKLVPSSSRVGIQPQASQTNVQAPISKHASNAHLTTLQDQINALQQEKLALEREQQERIAYEQALREMAIKQNQIEREQLKQQIQALEAQQKKAATAAAAAPNASSSSFHRHSQSSKLNSSSSIDAHLKSVTIDAYNDPNFKALLDQISKPLNVPAEKIELPAQWPSDGSLEHLADPIIIPAPEPIVISAPDLIRITENYQNSNSQSHFKTEVKFYPKNVDQKFYSNFDMSQLSVNK